MPVEPRVKIRSRVLYDALRRRAHELSLEHDTEINITDLVEMILTGQEEPVTVVLEE